MKKVLAIAVILILLSGVFVTNFERIYYTFYPHDRITGAFSITAQDEKVSNIRAFYDFEGNGKVRLENDAHSLSIPGDEYGKYKIGFWISASELYAITGDELFDGLGDIELSAVYFKTAWHLLADIDMSFRLAKEDGEWYIYYGIRYREVSFDRKTDTMEQNGKIKLDELGSKEILFGI